VGGIPAHARAKIVSPLSEEFFFIRLSSVPPALPLPYDLYLEVGGRHVLFRRRGDRLSADRIKRLHREGARNFLVPGDQRQLYMSSLVAQRRDPDQRAGLKARFMKEAALIHVHDLFTKPDISLAIEDSRGLVEEMVDFISEDTTAAASLMRLSTHDYYTYNHSVNVAVYSIALAKRVIGDDRKVLLAAGFGGLLHDLGKRKVDSDIINKRGPLTHEEWEEIKRHPEYGIQYLDQYNGIPKGAHEVVLEHHEAFDGTGYPKGLCGDTISLLAHVAAIADVFDALETMFSMQPGKFDPAIFRRFNKNFDKKGKVILDKNFDPCSARRSRRIKKR
jgi:putative nucleotidyltransferase with HDIG domain